MGGVFLFLFCFIFQAWGISSAIADCRRYQGLADLHPERVGPLTLPLQPVPPECQRPSTYLRPALGFSIIGVSSPGQSDLSPSDYGAVAHRLLQSYIALKALTAPVRCNPPGEGAAPAAIQYYFACYNRWAPESFDQFSTHINPNGESTSSSHTAFLSRWLSDLVNNAYWSSEETRLLLAQVTDHDIMLLRAYQNLMGAYSGALNRGAQGVSPNLALTQQQMQGVQTEFIRRMQQYQSYSVEDKLTLTQLLGLRFSMGFDHQRNEQQAAAEGVVSSAELLGAAYQNSVYDSYSDYDVFKNPNNRVAGVCRDIASTQALMLRIWGFPNTYVVSFARSDGSYHATVVSEDPRSHHRTFLLDYYALRAVEGLQGPAILNQGSGDIALNYRIYDPAGSGRANVLSPFGSFMLDIGGSGSSRVEPLAPQTHSLVQGNVRIRGTSSGVFYGTDIAGNTYVGIRSRYLYGSQGNFPGSIGLALGTRHAPVPNDQAINLDFLYLQWEQNIHFGQFALGKDVIAHIEALATGYFMAARTRDGPDDGAVSAQADLRLQPQVRVDVGNQWRNSTFLRFIMGIQVGPGISDIRDNNALQFPVPVLHYLLLSAEGRRKLAESGAGRAYLLAATRVLIDQFGARAQAELGIVVGDPQVLEIGARVGVTGRLSETEPMWQPGALRTVDGSITATIPPYLQIGAFVQQSIEGGPAPEVTSLMGTLTVTLDPVRRRP